MNQNTLENKGVFVFCHSFVTLFLLSNKSRALYNELDNLTTGGVSAEVMKDPEAPPLPLGKTARGSREKCRAKKLINGRAFLLHRRTSDPFCCMLGLLYAFQLSFLFHCFRLFSPVRLYSLLMPPSVTGRRRGRFFYA